MKTAITKILETLPEVDDKILLAELYERIPSLLLLPEQSDSRRIAELAWITSAKGMNNKFMKIIINAYE